MQQKAQLQNKPKQPLSAVNKNLQKNNAPSKNEQKPNVRTTEYKRMEEIFLTDPDSVTREEFLLFQSAVGYRRAIHLLNEGKRRKQLRKMDGTGGKVINLPVNKEQETTDSKDNKVIQKQKASQAAQKSENDPIQKKASTNNTSSGTSLPSGLKSGLEKLSGVDLSDVSVHKNSEKPQQVGALAYTQGNHIHIAPGQEKHLPHEGWHAVQQKQGRVAPTLQMKTGALVNEDAGLEKEADIMGGKAIKEGAKKDAIQLKKSSSIKQENNVIQRITQEEAMKLSKQNTHDANTSYSWNIKAGEYNRYVFEAQDMLRDIGYNLSKHGVDGKWSPGGETYNALLKFQKNCKDTYNGLKKNAPAQTLAQVSYMQGVEPTGKLDKATYNALKKEVSKNVNLGKGDEKKKGSEKAVEKSVSKEREIINQYRQRFLNDKSIKIDTDTQELRKRWIDNVLKEENISYQYYQIEGKERYYSNIINGYGMWLTSQSKISLEEIHKLLDTLGYIPIYGIMFDGINAALYLKESKYIEAALITASIIPIGKFVKGSKFLYKLSPKLEKFMVSAMNAIRKEADDLGNILKRLLKKMVIVNMLRLMDL